MSNRERPRGKKWVGTLTNKKGEVEVLGPTDVFANRTTRHNRKANTKMRRKR